MRNKQQGEILSHRVHLETVRQINLIRIALVQNGCFNDLPSKSFIIGEAVRYAFEAGAAFIAGYLPDNQTQGDGPAEADASGTDASVPAEPQETGEAGDSGTTAD